MPLFLWEYHLSPARTAFTLQCDFYECYSGCIDFNNPLMLANALMQQRVKSTFATVITQMYGSMISFKIKILYYTPECLKNNPLEPCCALQLTSFCYIIFLA